jgi:hypothetical protein
MPYDRSSKLLLQETKKGFVARLTAEAGGRDASVIAAVPILPRAANAPVGRD